MTVKLGQATFGRKNQLYKFLGARRACVSLELLITLAVPHR